MHNLILLSPRLLAFGPLKRLGMGCGRAPLPLRCGSASSASATSRQRLRGFASGREGGGGEERGGGGTAAAPAGAKGPLVKKPVLGRRKDVKKPSRGGKERRGDVIKNRVFSTPSGFKFSNFESGLGFRERRGIRVAAKRGKRREMKSH